MNDKGQTRKIIMIIVPLLSVLFTHPIPYFMSRSTGTDSVQRLINDAINYTYYNEDTMRSIALKKLHGSFTITPIISRSYDDQSIVRSLFCPDLIKTNGRNVVKISGSAVQERDATDWLADYFALRQDYESRLSFTPSIQNVVINLDLYINSHCFFPNLYGRINAPLTYTTWNIDLLEHNVRTSCSTSYPPGYFTDVNINYLELNDETKFSGVFCRNLLCTFAQFAADQQSPNLKTPNNMVNFDPLRHSMISRTELNKTGLAALQAAIGYNIINNESAHFGIEAWTSLPTGNRPEGKFLFEPIVGNGHHVEFGAGITGHRVLWQSKQTEQSCTFYCNALITHLFKTKQKRSFDLCDKPNSRYMLASHFKTPVKNLLVNENENNPTPPCAQFFGSFSPVANLTTFSVNVHVNLQVDAAALLQYQSKYATVEIGYNLWYKSKETIQFIKNKTVPITCNWGLKGDAFMYGFISEDDPDPLKRNLPIPLSSTEANATVHAGTNRPIGSPVVGPEDKNSGIDNRSPAFFNTNTPLLYAPLLNPSEETEQQTSHTPCLLTENNIDISSAETTGSSHKFFFNVGCRWNAECRFIPYCTWGLMIETARNKKSNYMHSNLSQWASWIKGGFNF